MPEPWPSGSVPEQTLATQHVAASAPIGETLAPPCAPATMIAPPTESKHVAGYVVERELGRGAMGVVYRARDGKLGRVVALKMILAGAHADIEDMQRFLSEAQAVANLQHPNIVQVHEIGREGDLPFFTLELVPGGTLAARLKGEPQTPRAAAHVVELLPRGVEHAHKAGIIHRDLKPANVLLVEDAATPLEHCTPKIADFGLAKRIEGGTGVTQSGAIMGTPSYMAPEQAGGQTKQVGPLSDVYALGAVLYEMLTGRPPFRATSTAETLLQVIAEEPVTVRQLQPKSPRDLATICHKCLQKDPARRYGSAAELADDLARFQKSEPIRARPVGRVERTWRWCQRNPVVAALLVLVSLASVFSVWQWRSAATALAQADAALAQVRAEQQARALAQVTALGEAVPAAVPGVLQELEAGRETTLPRLQELWRNETAVGKRMRVALALLPVEPDAVRDDLMKWLLETKDPDEAVLVRNALASHGAELSPTLWRTAEDVKAKADERFRCLVALAGFAPEDKRWPGLAQTAIAEMVASNPLHLRTWVQALRPVRASLLKPLQEVYRTGSAERREFAAIVLSDYASQEPGLLADLLLDADPKQYAVLFPVLQQYRTEMVARMRRAVRGEEFWTDAPLDAGWSAVPAEVRSQIESADGLLAERWAMCQTLPLEQLASVVEALRPCGYRPVRVRPFFLPSPPLRGRGAGGEGEASKQDTPSPPTPLPRSGGEGRKSGVRVAVVWTRDGRAFSLESGRAAIQPKAGLIPVDVAAYQDGPQVRFAAVWVKPNANEKAGFYAGVPAEQHRAAFADFQKADFEPLTLHALHDASGVVRYSGVWGNSAPKNALATWDNDDDSHRGRILLADKLAVDVGLNVSAKPVLGVDYWKQQRAGAEAQLATNADDLTARYNRGRALFRLGEEALADFDAVLAGDKPPVPAFRYRAQLHARAGRSDAARRDLAEFVKRTTSALNRQCVTALVAFERGDDAAGMTALDAARQAATDTAAADLASAYAFCASAAARWQTLDVAGLVGAPTALTPFLVRPLDRVKQLLDRAETHFTQALRTRSFTDFDLSADLSVLAGRAVYDKVLAERAKPKDHAVSVWHVDAKREAEQTYGMSVGANLERCRELAAEGYRPAALAVAVLTEGKTTTASVWQRPAPERLAREQLARRQATGAATMLQLEPAEEAWALFRQRPDSEARSQLIWRGQLLGLKASQLMRRLEEEKDVSAKRALVLALGEYDAEQLPENERRPLVAKLIQLYKDDPDPGLHGAIDWLLRHAKEGPADRRLNWGQAQALESIDKELQRRDTTGASPVALAPGGTTRGWYVNGQGQTMIKVVGPVEFRMGSPPSDLEQVANNERPHRRRIPRNFAMGARSVTIAEFERFLKEKPDAQHSYAKNYSPEATGPIIAVTWFQAAQYCNWLSEKEGLPETEWCYPKHEDIKEEMTLPKDHLKRKGYRLPTEAEWEFAARSGAASNRCYGSSLELLPRYA